ncbi:MAG: molecular chaperone HtpG [Sutterella sp.]|uniref:molecular chaperone HtpG n=1 Tax=Duodenibacillus massiliensis TaxID=1852381 RepID=UPI00258A8AFF|nr:molecular chaperone HtpG [uncultured Duodenibacillus sp.]MBE5702076.1 molecular chaperone HtpG [Sutterella sp.]MBS1386567.1 molecular chaperone HtpG [Duodenibacillus sp.]
MAAQLHGFQTEVAKLLDLLANSLYSNKEVFLRELISNASDALDKLHFLSLTDQKLLGDDPILRIRVKADKDAGTLTISDNGIGMTVEEAQEHLGTIAKSGTDEFFKSLSGDAAKDSQLIGRFGVGFYSAFIVADKVTVYSRSAKAAQNEGVCWESEGLGTYTAERIDRKERGTDIVLHLKADAQKFLDAWVLETAITKYSDHIAVPVYLWKEKTAETPKEGEKPAAPVFEWVQVNDAKALWTINPRDVKDEQYKEFYRHLTHAYDDPLVWSHNKVEGELEYTSLLYIPTEAPWDLFNRDAEHGLKLFVQRVFIMDEAEQFLPHYLRFVRGLVDTNDLPLNVSREMLQETAVTQKLKKALTHRVLTMLEKLAKDDPAKYAAFWKTFGRVLKEGPVEDPANRGTLMKLMRFASTKAGTGSEDVSLADYVARMPKGQDKIYYLVATSRQTAETSPYLEELKKKGIEVLLMWERIDEWLMGNLFEYEGKAFVSVTSSDLELGELADKKDEAKEKEAAEKAKPLVERFKKALGDKVVDVRAATRLTDSPSCVVAENGSFISAQMRRMFEAAGQPVPEARYILEVNVNHPLVQKAAAGDDAAFERWAKVILDQAVLAEQGTLADPNGFIREMNALLAS